MISRLTRLIDQRIITGPENRTQVCWTNIASYIENDIEMCPLVKHNADECTNCPLDSIKKLYANIEPIQSAVSNCYPDPRASDVHAAECERAFREYLDGE